jgi:hypothetical protein
MTKKNPVKKGSKLGSVKPLTNRFGGPTGKG